MRQLRAASITKPCHANPWQRFMKEYSDVVGQEFEKWWGSGTFSKVEKLNMCGTVARDLLAGEYASEVPRMKELVEEEFNTLMKAYESSVASAQVADDVNA